MNMSWRWVSVGNDRVLAVAIGASIVIHGIALAVHFKLPERLLTTAYEPKLEVVLVNAKTKERPSKAQVLAYGDYCDALLDAAVDALDLESQSSGFYWYAMPKLEHQLVNIRHIQHHAAQLADRLRARLDMHVDWVGGSRS